MSKMHSFCENRKFEGTPTPYYDPKHFRIRWLWPKSLDWGRFSSNTLCSVCKAACNWFLVSRYSHPQQTSIKLQLFFATFFCNFFTFQNFRPSGPFSSFLHFYIISKFSWHFETFFFCRFAVLETNVLCSNQFLRIMIPIFSIIDECSNIDTGNHLIKIR